MRTSLARDLYESSQRLLAQQLLNTRTRHVTGFFINYWKPKRQREILDFLDEFIVTESLATLGRLIGSRLRLWYAGRLWWNRVCV